jgi:hypothetical protein
MRLSKRVLWRSIPPLALVLCLLVATKLWIRSESAHRQIREALSRSTGMEVKFEKLQTSLRKGIRIKTLTGAAPHGASLQVREIHIRPSFLRLLMGRLVLAEVRLDTPRFIWVDRPGDPESPPAPLALEANPLNNLSGNSPSSAKRSIEKIVVENGDFTWISKSNQNLLHLDGISLLFQADEAGNGSGRLLVAKGAVLETLAFHGLHAPISLASGVLSVPQLTAKSGGGQLTASFSGELTRPGIPFRAEAGLHHVDFAQMSQEIPASKMAGMASGAFRLESPALRTAEITGEGKIQITDGFFKSFSLLQIVGQIFQIQELANLKIRHGSAEFTVANRQILFNPLVLRSDDLVLEAPGSLDFDKQLALQARLTLPEKLLKSKNIQGFLSRFSPADSAGNRSIDFKITGSYEKPRTDLVEKMMPDGVGGLLQQVLGNFLKPKSPPKKETPDGSAPPADPPPKNR